VEFDWDAENRGKNLRHGVHDREIEEALKDPRRRLKARITVRGERRLILLARAESSGKYLRIVYTVRIREGQRLIRPISAIVMPSKDRRTYGRD